jgi:hypothetical protein
VPFFEVGTFHITNNNIPRNFGGKKKQTLCFTVHAQYEYNTCDYQTKQENAEKEYMPTKQRVEKYQTKTDLKWQKNTVT